MEPLPVSASVTVPSPFSVTVKMDVSPTEPVTTVPASFALSVMSAAAASPTMPFRPLLPLTTSLYA